MCRGISGPAPLGIRCSRPQKLGEPTNTQRPPPTSIYRYLDRRILRGFPGDDVIHAAPSAQRLTVPWRMLSSRSVPSSQTACEMRQHGRGNGIRCLEHPRGSPCPVDSTPGCHQGMLQPGQNEKMSRLPRSFPSVLSATFCFPPGCSSGRTEGIVCLCARTSGRVPPATTARGTRKPKMAADSRFPPRMDGAVPWEGGRAGAPSPQLTRRRTAPLPMNEWPLSASGVAGSFEPQP